MSLNLILGAVAVVLGIAYFTVRGNRKEGGSRK